MVEPASNFVVGGAGFHGPGSKGWGKARLWGVLLGQGQPPPPSLSAWEACPPGFQKKKTIPCYYSCSCFLRGSMAAYGPAPYLLFSDPFLPALLSLSGLPPSHPSLLVLFLFSCLVGFLASISFSHLCFECCCVVACVLLVCVVAHACVDC